MKFWSLLVVSCLFSLSAHAGLKAVTSAGSGGGGGSVVGGTCTNQVATAIASSSASPTCTTVTSGYVNTTIAVTGVDINTSSQVTSTHLSAPLPTNQGGTALTSLNATSVVYASTSSAMATSANLTWDNTNNRLTAGVALNLNNASATTNQKNWRWFVDNSGVMTLAAVSDAGTPSSAFFQADRVGVNVDQFTYMLSDGTHTINWAMQTGATPITQISASAGLDTFTVETSGDTSDGAGGDLQSGSNAVVNNLVATSSGSSAPILAGGPATGAASYLFNDGAFPFCFGTNVTGSFCISGSNQVVTFQAAPIFNTVLAPASGGTNNGFFAVTGPATSTKTFTFPNASATVLTSNATVTAAQGGTSFSSYTKGDLLCASGSTTLTKLGVGSDTNILTADSTQTCGVKWAATSGLSIPTGTATFTPGTNVTSVVCASGYSCNNTRGTLTIVGGTATTGTIATVSFSATLSAAPACFATMNGGATAFGIGNSAPSTTAFNITSAVSVVAATFNVNYQCQP